MTLEYTVEVQTDLLPTDSAIEAFKGYFKSIHPELNYKYSSHYAPEWNNDWSLLYNIFCRPFTSDLSHFDMRYGHSSLTMHDFPNPCHKVDSWQYHDVWVEDRKNHFDYRLTVDNYIPQPKPIKIVHEMKERPRNDVHFNVQKPAAKIYPQTVYNSDYGQVLKEQKVMLDSFETAKKQQKSDRYYQEKLDHEIAKEAMMLDHYKAKNDAKKAQKFDLHKVDLKEQQAILDSIQSSNQKADMQEQRDILQAIRNSAESENQRADTQEQKDILQAIQNSMQDNTIASGPGNYQPEYSSNPNASAPPAYDDLPPSYNQLYPNLNNAPDGPPPSYHDLYGY